MLPDHQAHHGALAVPALAAGMGDERGWRLSQDTGVWNWPLRRGARLPTGQCARAVSVLAWHLESQI